MNTMNGQAHAALSTHESFCHNVSELAMSHARHAATFHRVTDAPIVEYHMGEVVQWAKTLEASLYLAVQS